MPVLLHLRRHRWLLFWLACAAFLVARATQRRDSRGVILDHLEFGRRLLHGEDVYGPWRSDPDAPVRPLHAPYPPSFGLLTAPFSVVADTLGVRAARCSWALMQIGCLLACALVLRRRLAARAPPALAAYWHWLWLATALVGLRFLLRDMHGGGGNIVNLALCLLAFDAAESDRTRRAGLCLALSLVTKPTQLWLLPVFLLFGRVRVVAWTAVWSTAAVALTMLLQHFDLAPWQRWAEGSFRLATQTDAFAVPALDFPPFEWMNQSLRCAVARWAGTVPPDLAARVTLGIGAGLGLAPAAVAWTTRLLSLGLLCCLLGTTRTTRTAPLARLWVFAAALVLSVLLSPLSWKAHHVALLPVLLLLLRDALARRSPWPWLVLGGWVVCCVPGGDLVGDDMDEWMNSTYVVTAWDVVLLVWALLAARSAAHEHGDSTLPHQRVQVDRQ